MTQKHKITAEINKNIKFLLLGTKKAPYDYCQACAKTSVSFIRSRDSMGIWHLGDALT